MTSGKRETNTPINVRVLEEKPGCEWSRVDVDRVYRWWLEREQERLIWGAAFRYLGAGVSIEDVEEAWAAFYSTGFDKFRRSYKPGGPDFATYAVHVCFKRECIRRGDEIRKRLRASVPLSVAAVEYGACDEEVLDASVDPHAMVERQFIIAEVQKFLAEGSIPPQQKRAFELKHFHEMTNEEISVDMCAEVGTVKVWIHRAAARVQEYLRKKGWVN